MDKSNIMFLIKKSHEQDAIGQFVPTETSRQVFCDIGSVGQTEFFEAGRNGFKAALQVTMFAYDYDGENECEIEGVRYSVYRTYRRKDDNIELYLEKRVGKK